MLVVIATALVLASLMPGCGGKKMEPPPAPEPEKPAPMLRVDVAAASNANRGPSGQGLPVVVRLYELSAQGAFSSADFFSLYNDQAGALGGELVASEEMNLAPGADRLLAKPLSPDARYLGVLAAFRDIDNAQWRALVPLAAETNNTLGVIIGADAIRIEPL
jgi:type VI secretion system protein VasD